jgi:hypothetical protein
VQDEELRQLERDAVDAGSWLRCASALLRARRFDEAAVATERAATAGLELDEVERLEESRDPDDLATLTIRERLAPIAGAAWSFDGTGLFGVQGRSKLVRIALGGATEEILDVPERVVALAADLTGARLALASVRRREAGWEAELRALDLATGRLEPPLGSKHSRIDQVAIHGAVVLCAYGERVRLYRRDEPSARSVDWRGDRLALSARGEIAAIRGDELCLFDPPGKLPRARVALARRLDGLRWFRREDRRFCVLTTASYPGLVVAGRGAIVFSRQGQLHRFDRAARLVGGTTARGASVFVPSPTGRFVVASADAPEVTILDLKLGTSRSLDTGETARTAAWSPSGRKLAIGTTSALLLFSFD